MYPLKRCIFALIFCLYGAAAQAVPMEWTDSIDFNSDVYFGSARKGGVSSFTFTHNLLDDGFRPGTDLIWDYDLSIGLYDDNDRKKSEWAFIDMPGIFADRVVEVDYFDADLGVSLAGLLSLNFDGLLEVTIKRMSGDFYLDGSVLNARGNAVASVPEPATLGLFALGLAGLVSARRRQQ
jgi:hypothetical protein